MLWFKKKPTKFKTALKNLKRIANGRYFSMQYELTTYTDGKKSVQCMVYIDGYKWYTGLTWSDAIRDLKKAMKPITTKPNDPNMIESPED